MALSHNSNEYHVDSFLSMQKDLSNYLNEDHTIDGHWTVAEKKRFINKGCVAVATHTLTTHAVTSWDETGSTTTPTKQIQVPDLTIQPKRLFVDSNEYIEVQLDEFLSHLGNSLRSTSGTTSTTNVAHLQQLNRFFWWNEGSNTFDLNPPITEALEVTLYHLKMPKTLVEPGDISDLHPSWSYLAPVWAAMMMLDRDEEHRDRGEAARRRWLKGLADFERFKHRRAGNRSLSIQKDPHTFGGHNIFNTSGTDLGDTWDRLP